MKLKKISLYSSILFNAARKEGIDSAGGIAFGLICQCFKQRGEKIAREVEAIKQQVNFFFQVKYGSKEVKQRELCKACLEGDIVKVKKLLSWGADPNMRNTSGDGILPLTAAVKSGNINLIRLLLDAGANINPLRPEKDEGYYILNYGEELVSPLKQACYDNYKNSPEIIAFLLENGAILKPEHLITVCSQGYDLVATPEGALKRVDLNIRIINVEMFLNRGIDPNDPKFTTRDPLDEVNANYDVDTTKLLLKAGAKPQSLNKAFMVFRDAYKEYEKQEKAKQIIRLFLDAGADLRRLHAYWYKTFKEINIATLEEISLIEHLERGGGTQESWICQCLKVNKNEPQRPRGHKGNLQKREITR